MKCEFSFVIDDGMTCITAALKTNYNIIILGQKVYHSAFTFIAPVDTDNCAICHIKILQKLHKKETMGP